MPAGTSAMDDISMLSVSSSNFKAGRTRSCFTSRTEETVSEIEYFTRIILSTAGWLIQMKRYLFRAALSTKPPYSE